MTLPKEAWDKILEFEGRWSNDQNDPGGATFLGIARNRNPQWVGWAIVDESMKPGGHFLPNDLEITHLTDLARNFYAEKWEVLLFGRFVHQSLAVYVFDTAVNVGAARAIFMLQKALNALNDGGRLWSDVDADGVMGPKTLIAEARAAMSPRRDSVLFSMRVLRAGHYLRLCDDAPARWERYAWGWLRRAAS
jgi:lysozyme family protein